MNHIETYAKFGIHEGCLTEFQSRVKTLVDVVKEKDPGTLRYDWFINSDKMECVAMDAYIDEESMYAHQRNAAKYMGAVLECSDISVVFLGLPSEPAREKIMKFKPRLFDFHSGLGNESAASGFSPVEIPGGSSHIEVYAQFTVEPEHYDLFKQTASELLEIVKRDDLETLRYDWFYDDENCQCTTMDIYKDAEGMFSHMKNAHEKHSELMRFSTLYTEFLGELPEQARSAVAKYDPNILPFFKGLNSCSSGGLNRAG